MERPPSQLTIRHAKHRGKAPVLLSLAVIKWAGAVTDAIDGASMDVDYVRVWQRENPRQDQDRESHSSRHRSTP